MFSFIKKLFDVKNESRFPHIDHLLFGIGNIGIKYEGTRHNIGFSILDCVYKKINAIQKGTGCESDFFVFHLPNKKNVLCAKPLTYVNKSGGALRALIDTYNLPLSSCLVILDDFHLPLGTLRFKRGGSDGGHNGLKSVIEAVGKDFPRLKVGIGPLPDATSIIDFVLGTFSESENIKVKNMVKAASDAGIYFCNQGIDKSMNTYNSLQL